MRLFASAPPFRDRRDAGRQLADALRPLRLPDPVVLALPRGGVPVGYEVARALHAPLDVLLVRKIGAPGHPEYGIGAVVDGSQPSRILDEEAMKIVRPSAHYVKAETARQVAEIERRRALYGGDRAVPTEGRTIILVDDGMATGGTAQVALKALRNAAPTVIVLAIPAAPRAIVEKLGHEADRIICLHAPDEFLAVGLCYENFDQTQDQEVIDLLRAARIDGGQAAT